MQKSFIQLFDATGEQLPVRSFESTRAFANHFGITMDRAYNVIANWKTIGSKFKFKYGVERIMLGDD